MSNMHSSVSGDIRVRRDALVRAIISRLYNLGPDECQLSNHAGYEKSVRDVGYHLDFLCQAIDAKAPVLFTDYVQWVKVLFDGMSFAPQVVEDSLEVMRGVLAEHLPPTSFAPAAETITAGLERLRAGTRIPPIYIEPGQPHGMLARDYLNAMLRGDRQTATLLILAAAERGVPVKDLYLYVLQRAQYEVGRLWHIHQISVAQEHFCTFVTQLIMSRLLPHFSTAPRVNQRMLATCIGGEMHELGIRMVADFFEMAGWDTFFLGANTPGDSIIQFMTEHPVDLLAISASIAIHVGEVADLIEKVRASASGHKVKIIVGGHPFTASEHLWQTVQADGFGRDAQHALAVANSLMG